MSDDCCSEIRECLEGAYDSRYDDLPELVSLNLDKAIQSAIGGAAAGARFAPEDKSRKIAALVGAGYGFVVGAVGDVVEAAGSRLHYEAARAKLESEIQLEQRSILDLIPRHSEFKWKSGLYPDFASYLWSEGLELPDDDRVEYWDSLVTDADYSNTLDYTVPRLQPGDYGYDAYYPLLATPEVRDYLVSLRKGPGELDMTSNIGHNMFMEYAQTPELLFEFIYPDSPLALLLSSQDIQTDLLYELLNYTDQEGTEIFDQAVERSMFRARGVDPDQETTVVTMGYEDGTYRVGQQPLGELLPNPIEQFDSDIKSLKNDLLNLKDKVTSVQSQASGASTKAILAEHKASQAMSTAVRALSKAGSCSCTPSNSAVADSDAETPSHVPPSGKGPN